MTEYLLKGACTSVIKNKTVLAATAFLVVMTGLSMIIPAFSPYQYSYQDLNHTFLPPLSGGHIFGTDEFGRDLFTRVWMGVGISITIGFCAAFLQAVIGTVYGGFSGMMGGTVDEVMMRFADVVYSVPYLMIVILLTMIFGSGEFTLILALAVADWTGVARIVRVKTMQLKEMEFVQASKVLGAGKMHILLIHILPNCIGSILVSMMFSIPAAIFTEAFLSFMGLGVRIPKASLGTLISDGYAHVVLYPWLLMIPLVVITVAMLAFHILGDALQGSPGR